MPRASKQRSDAREKEIIDACKRLYETKNFKDITLKDIGEITSMSRPSIYNYFETKEEIFLAILKEEYQLWTKSLNDLIDNNNKLSHEEFAAAIAHSLEERELLLKLMSMNNYDMEENSRPQKLEEFKREYGKSLELVDKCLEKFTNLSATERKEFVYIFFPFVYGIYPYTRVTPKQKEAMQKVNVPFIYHSIYDLTYVCFKNLLDRKER